MRKAAEFALVVVLACAVFLVIFNTAKLIEGDVVSSNSFTVESFTPDLTIRIQCSGDCDLAAMIAEAREAATK